MSLLDLFKKKALEPPQKAAKPDDAEEMEIYSGMRVEVTDTKDIFLFVGTAGQPGGAAPVLGGRDLLSGGPGAYARQDQGIQRP